MTDEVEEIDFEHADLERVTELLEVLVARDDDRGGDGAQVPEAELAEARARILSKVLRSPISQHPISQQPEEVPTEQWRGAPADDTPGRSAAASQRRTAFHNRRRLNRVKRLCSRAERLDLALTKIEVASSAQLGPISASARTQLAKLTDTVQEQISNGTGRRLRKVGYFNASLTCGLLIADFAILAVALNAIFSPASTVWGTVSSFALALLVVGMQTRLGLTVGERFRNPAIGLGSVVILALVSALSGFTVFTHFFATSAPVLAAATLAAACVIMAPWPVALLEQSTTTIELKEIRRLRVALCRRDSRMLRAYRVTLRDLRSAHRVINATERLQAKRPSGQYSEILQEMYATLMSADERARYALWRFSQPLSPLESLSQTRGPADDVDAEHLSEQPVSDEDWRLFEQQLNSN